MTKWWIGGYGQVAAGNVKGGLPIILDLDGTGVQITELSRSTVFMDSGGDGLLHRTAWGGQWGAVL